MPGQLSTGAIYVFLAPPTGNTYAGGGTPQVGTPQFFGTCESMPQDQRQPEYEMLMNDASGSKVPLDLAWEGESAQISLVVTRPNQQLVELLQTKGFPGAVAANTAASTAGSWSFNDVGSLMSLEGLAWTCWLAYGFGAALGNKLAYTGANGFLRPGRRYVQCALWAPQSDETGSKPMKQHFMLYAWPYVDFKNQRVVLYDYNMSAITQNMIT